MIIANPIYDVVFKFLMEDERIAKFFISTLLNESVDELTIKPQEYVYTDELIGLAVFRLDFIATIRSQGEHKKVLIEIQKARNYFDLMRFRNYLGEQYKKEDNINGSKMSLPIITVYLLGFNLPDIETTVLKVNRVYIDLINNKIIDKKSDFIEKLTHDCFVVQLNRIQGKEHTLLEKLLTVFEQNYFVENNSIKQYDHTIDNEDIKRMVEKLHYAGTEPKEKKKLEDEIEAWRTFDALTGNIKDKADELLKQVEEQKKLVEEKEKEAEEQKKRVEEKEKELEDQKKHAEEQNRIIQENAKIIEDLKRRLNDRDT